LSLIKLTVPCFRFYLCWLDEKRFEWSLKSYR